MSHLVAAYSRPQAEAGVFIEQTDYAPYTGQVTRYAMAVLLDNLLFDKDKELPTDCGIVGGAFMTVVLFYPSPAELPFTAHVSRGDLGPGQVENSSRSEIINFRLDQTASLRYPAQEITGVEWLTDTFDAKLQPAPRPSLSLSGQSSVMASAKIYGAARITYTVRVQIHSLVIAGREESIENKYSSVAYAVYSGGVDWLELSAPPGAEDYDGDCKHGGGQVTPDDDPDDPEPDADGADRTIKIDYCSREIISDSAA